MKDKRASQYVPLFWQPKASEINPSFRSGLRRVLNKVGKSNSAEERTNRKQAMGCIYMSSDNKACMVVRPEGVNVLVNVALMYSSFTQERWMDSKYVLYGTSVI